MAGEQKTQKVGLVICLQRPVSINVQRVPGWRDTEGKLIHPDVETDGDHVHFKMVTMEGDSLLWLTIRREILLELVATSPSKIADLIDRYGHIILNLSQEKQGSFESDGQLAEGPLRWMYGRNGDVVIPGDVK